MIDQRNRALMKEALVKPFGSPRPDLERLALASIARRPTHAMPTRTLALALVVLLLALAVSVTLARGIVHLDAQPAGQAPSYDTALLLALEHRPLNIPAMPANGECPDTPTFIRDIATRADNLMTWESLYGSQAGPVYAGAGPAGIGSHGQYYFATWVSDPSYQGLVLVRGKKLNGPERIVFAGSMARGSLVTTDVVAGARATKLYSELVLPAGPPAHGLWRSWAVTQGVPGPGCYAIQVDGPSFQEIVVFSVARW